MNVFLGMNVPSLRVTSLTVTRGKDTEFQKIIRDKSKGVEQGRFKFNGGGRTDADAVESQDFLQYAVYFVHLAY